MCTSRKESRAVYGLQQRQQMGTSAQESINFSKARARTPVLSLALAVCVRGCGIEPYCTRSDDKFFVLLVGARLIGLYTRMVGSCF